MAVSRAKILINAVAYARFDEAMHDRLTEIFTRAGASADITIARTAEELAASAKAAIEDAFDLVVAGGGDGTVNLVASALVGSGKHFGVIPLGTLNHFAKDLNIPLDFDEAVQNLLSGSAVQVDVAEVNGQIFLNNSSLGLYPTMVRERVKHQRLGSGKWPAFVWAAMTAFRRYPFVDVRVTINDQLIARRTPFLFVGNNGYVMEGFNIGSRERLDSAQLSLYMTHRTGRWGLLRLALRALLRRLRNDKDFLALRTPEVTIHTRRLRTRVALDGEVFVLQTPLHYRSRPGALSVIVPGRTKVEG
jgi:diacylglycerol kinase family enzyme